MESMRSTASDAPISERDQHNLDQIEHAKALVVEMMKAEVAARGLDPSRVMMDGDLAEFIQKFFEISEDGIRDGLTHAEQRARLKALFTTMKLRKEDR